MSKRRHSEKNFCRGYLDEEESELHQFIGMRLFRDLECKIFPLIHLLRFVRIYVFWEVVLKIISVGASFTPYKDAYCNFKAFEI